jgi:hypothetical protein
MSEITARPLRSCDVCGQVDDHPRHTHHPEAPVDVNSEHIDAVLDLGLDSEVRNRIVREISDPMSQQRHFDCCRAAGCPDGTCNDAPDLTGQALIDHLTGAASVPAETPKEG